ncbi:hypothetical protein ACLOJK_020793 [Asimina triloba]
MPSFCERYHSISTRPPENEVAAHAGLLGFYEPNKGQHTKRRITCITGCGQELGWPVGLECELYILRAWLFAATKISRDSLGNERCSVLAASFTLTNNCQISVWPGVLSGAGTAPLSSTGFLLQKGESKTLSVPAGWSGRFWGRTYCSEDSTGKFSCVTGDCGSDKLECAAAAKPPATLAEFTLNGADGLDFYDVSLVDGYNLPMLVVPQGGSGNCTTTGCLVDLNGRCPSELRVTSADGDSVACKSACEAFGDSQYCCSGTHATPDTCKPTSYSQLFKQTCPRAYSYAYDDGTSTFTCTSADYVITFCPTVSTSQKSSGGHPEAAALPLVNTSMIYVGNEESSNAAPGRLQTATAGLAGLSVLATVIAVLLL